MADKETWILELVFRDGFTKKYPITEQTVRFFLHPAYGDGMTRIEGLLCGRTATLMQEGICIRGDVIGMARIFLEKGNPLDDTTHYDDPLN